MKPVDSVTQGTFLVASPLLRDPNFLRTVVLVCEHGDGGSWGLIVNRRTELTISELVDDMPVPSVVPGVVHWGGPVETTRLQVLHRLRRIYLSGRSGTRQNGRLEGGLQEAAAQRRSGWATCEI